MNERIPALETIQWPIENLRPYENNAKIHTPAQVKAIASLIRRFGFDQPIVVDGAGVIIKGHGRWLAAQYLGMKFVPVIVRTDLTAKEAAASRLADNRVAEGNNDTEKLHAELTALSESGEIEMDELGFSEKELSFLTDDLGVIEDTAVVGADELGSSKVTETEADIESLSNEEMALNKVLGFSKIPGEAAPRVTQFMTALEADTGLTGADAFLQWIDGYLEARASAAV